MSATPTRYLIVAVTGRALAASAARGGHRTVVLDCFADRDTGALAAASRSVVSPRGLRLDPSALLEAAAELAPGAALVYGSGLEGRPGLLRRLGAGRMVYGNRPDVVAAVRDPDRFFPLLDRLRIPYPEVRHAVPADPAGWLSKRPGGAGGSQIRHARNGRAPADAYFQRLVPGRPHSALFLADGARAVVLGFNRQWTAPVHPRLPFLYGGAVGGIRLPAGTARDIRAAVDALVLATGLVGLNGLDFILEEDRWLVLELNPRPTATVELYDPDYRRGLFDWQLRACRGELPERPAAPRAARAHAVVHAPGPGIAGPTLVFPPWCRDLPALGTRFELGDPVCTVHAAGPEPAQALRLLERRRAQIQAALGVAAA